LVKQHNLTKSPTSFVIPKGIIRIGKVLQFVSTDLATLFAARLFSSPLRFKTPERELVMRESSKKEKLSIPSINAEVQVYVYGYSKDC